MASWHESAPFTSLMVPQDAIPYEGALDRLVRAKVVCDEQLMDYELSQALRGVTLAVKSTALSFMPPFPLTPHAVATGAASSSVTNEFSEDNPVHKHSTGLAERRASGNVFGREAVLYRMCVSAVTNPRSLATHVYLSTRLLCDAATAFGEGNARPCCTPEWLHVLAAPALCALSDSTRAPSEVHEGEGMRTSAAFQAQVLIDRRFQLGYLRLVTGTLRMVASGAATGRHVFSDFITFADIVFSHVMPFAAVVAEGKGDAIASASSAGLTSSRNRQEGSEAATDAGTHAGGMGQPSLLTAEANAFLIQATHWLCMDMLEVHLDTSEKGTSKKNAVLDREVPSRLWTHVPRLRTAFQRALGWLEQEMTCRVQRARDAHQRQETKAEGNSVMEKQKRNADSCSQGVVAVPAPSQEEVRLCQGSTQRVLALASADSHAALNLVRAAYEHLDSVLSDAVKEQERLDFARRAAIQRFGESAKDVHTVGEAMWAGTLHLCIMLHRVTGAWVAVQGGLGLGATTHGIVLATSRDVLLYVASCVSRLPVAGDGLGTAQDRRPVIAAATDALLSAVVAVAAAAPLSAMQAALWRAEGGAITREVHGALTQRGLRFKDPRVLQLTSLLMNSIMNTAMAVTGASAGFQGHDSGVRDAGGALFAAETAEQLLDMLAESRDAASRVAVGLLTSAVAQRPHIIVPSLFRLLKSENRHARENAMDVLSGLPTALVDASGNAGERGSAGKKTSNADVARVAVSADRLREVLRLLAEQLLLHLGDEDLVARMRAAALFDKVWPEDVMFPLLKLCLQRDSRGVKQSVAKAALTSVLSAHREDAHVVLVLLREAYSLLTADGSVGPRSGEPNAEGASPAEIGSASPPPFTRAAPVTPGDILTRSLLFTPSIDGDDAEHSASEEAPASGSPGGSPVKADRLHSLVSSLLLLWTKAFTDADEVSKPSATRGAISAATHVVPVLDAMGALTDPREQQFYVRHGTGLLSALTAPVVSGQRSGIQRPVSAGQRAVAEGIEESMLIGSGAERTSLPPEENQYEWLNRIAHAASNGDGEPSEGDLYRILLPLLCLRSCDRGPFIDVESTSLDDVSGSSAVMSASARKPKPVGQIAFDCVWRALMCEPYCTFFSRHQRNMQRVLLEVVCKAPFALTFSKLQPLEQHWDQHGICTESSFFIARVTVFAMFSYLPALLAAPAVSGSRHVGVECEPTSHDAAGDSLLRLCASIVTSLWPAVFGPLATTTRDTLSAAASVSGSKSPSSTLPASEIPLRILQHGLLDATALVLLGTISTGDAATWSAVRELGLLDVPSETTNDGRGDQKPAIQAYSLPLVPDIHEHALTILHAHPRGADLLRLWCIHCQQPVIALANSACKTEPKPCPTAVKCGEVIFRAVMLSSKLPSTTTFSGSHHGGHQVTPPIDIRNTAPRTPPVTEVGSDDSPSFFQRNASSVNCGALVSFGIGCARSRYGIPLQQVGVRILAALLGAALDRLLTLEPSPMDTILDVLRNIAMIHEDARTRQLAEQVLQSLPALSSQR